MMFLHLFIDKLLSRFTAHFVIDLMVAFSSSYFIWLNFSGVTVLLALTVFNTMVTEILPKVSDALPILG